MLQKGHIFVAILLSLEGQSEETGILCLTKTVHKNWLVWAGTWPFPSNFFWMHVGKRVFTLPIWKNTYQETLCMMFFLNLSLSYLKTRNLISWKGLCVMYTEQTKKTLVTTHTQTSHAHMQSLLLISEGHLSVTDERMCMEYKLTAQLALACPAKVWLG